MFDMKMVSERIREARIKKNLTQSNLADELGVSFQAVSNWERGNSLPDISKYEDLCRALDVKLEYLLGIGSETDTVNKLLKRKKEEGAEPVTAKEIAPIAPLLLPEELKEVVSEKAEFEEVKMDWLIGILPFLDRDTAEQLAAKTVSCDIHELVAAAPFLSKKRLSELTRRWIDLKADSEEISGDFVIALAPFLDKEILGELLERMKPDDFGMLYAIVPFLPEEKLDRLAKELTPGDLCELTGIAPFLSRERVDELAEKVDLLDFSQLMGIAPFLSRERVDELAEKVDLSDLSDFSELTNIAPFLSKGKLTELVERIGCGEGLSIHSIAGLAPFLDESVLDRLLEQADIEDGAVIAELAPFVSQDTLRKMIMKVAR